MKLNYIFLFMLFLMFSCQDENIKNTHLHSIKVTETNGYKVPKDSIQSPINIPAGNPKVVKAGIPKSVLANTNVHTSGIPKLILAGKPNRRTPGEDTFLIPKKILTRGKTTPVGNPEIIIPKDAATKDINPENFSFYKAMQGFKYTTIFCMLQDKNGNIWFGTNGGVCRYDGKRFVYYTEKEGLSNNNINAILEDKKGNLWFGTDGGGICRYDGNIFTNFTEKEGLSNNSVSAIIEDKVGNLWIGTYGGGLSRFDGKSFINFTDKEGLSNNLVLSILEDKIGNLWIGTNGGGICFYDGKSFSNYTKKEGLSSNFILSILEDKAGNIWFGTYGGGACSYDGKFFTNLTIKEGLSSNTVNKMIQDKDENIWFGTYDGGASCYNGKTFINFTEKEGLSNNTVWSILEDKSRNLWFATDAGISKYYGKSFKNFTKNEGLPTNVVNAIKEDKNGNLWFGTNDGGLSCYNGKSFSNFTKKEGLPTDFINTILEDKSGNLWFGTIGGGACCYDGECFSNFTEKEGLANNFISSIIEDKIGNLWFGTYGGGVCRYDGNRVDAIERGEKIPFRDQDDLKKSNGKLVKSFTNFTEKEGLSNNFISSILEDRAGNIWFSTDGGGVCRFDGESFTHFTEKEGLISNFVNTILEDNIGNLWFGTNGGVCRYDGNRVDAIERGEKTALRNQLDLKKINGKFVKSFINFTEKEGLSNNNVQSIIQDFDGNIWLGTLKGLSKIKYSQLTKLFCEKETFNPKKEGFFYNYLHGDGFIGLSSNRNSVFQDSKGSIWWGASVLTCYNTKGDIIDTTAPVVNLTGINLFGEEIIWSNLHAVYYDNMGKELVKGKINDTILSNSVLLKDIEFNGLTKWYNLPENLSLPYSNNSLTFNFIGIHIQNSGHIKYQYKLDGVDPDWSSITEKTEAVYNNLRSGDYIFNVKAMNQSGIWSEPLNYKFTIRPPFWETWWFRTMLVLFIMGLIWLYIKNREKKLVAEKEKLERTVEERTAEVVEEKKIVEVQKKIVEYQKYLIEEKHKEISDSINYAERIQKSFLATEDFLDEYLKDYFILYKPKDIVSGDFYWAEKLNNDQLAISIADSTGHGIPGAFMSLLNISLLNEATFSKRFSKTNDILNFVRKILMLALKPNEMGQGGNDGMDCVLFSIDFYNLKLQFTGANNSLLIIRKGVLLEYKGDKMSVGRSMKEHIPFSNQIIEIQKSDMIYAFTDGYADQFGGEKGKKFMSKQLKELLLSISEFDLQDQKQKLDDAIIKWKGDLDQTDDITIMGIRV